MVKNDNSLNVVKNHNVSPNNTVKNDNKNSAKNDNLSPM